MCVCSFGGLGGQVEVGWKKHEKKFSPPPPFPISEELKIWFLSIFIMKTTLLGSMKIGFDVKFLRLVCE